MRASQDNNLFVSVFLYAEHQYLQLGQAYNTVTTKLYYTPDTRLPAGFASYNSPIKQWVYDSGVSGAYIINEVSGGGFSAPLTRASGIHVDYENGRVIVPSALGTSLTLTGTYSYKEVNIYAPSETEEQILTQNKYYLNPRYGMPFNSGVSPYVYATPAMFMNILASRNEAYQFGGLVDSKSTVSFTILAETNFQLTALLSLFRDMRYQYIPMCNLPDDPLDQWGDVKGGTGYNYLTVVRNFGVPGNLIYVENTHTARVKDISRLNPRQFAGIVDLDLSYIRQSPIGSNLFV